MAAFSWSDTVKATFGTCLPCLWSANPSRTESNDVLIHTNEGIHRIARARPDELQGLLADAGDTDTEAETHSLHSDLDAPRSNYRRSRQSRRTGRPKSITFWGWNLFGRPAVQLPADDDDDDNPGHRGDDDGVERRRHARTGDAWSSRSGNHRKSREVYRSGGSQTASSNTLDADAAPLDPSTIDGLSPAQLQERAFAAAAEEERRRQRRKERKELKRAARALAMGALDGDTFEGFPGSGGGGPGGYPRVPSPFARHRDPSSREAFGPFVDAHQRDADDDTEDADLGGELYARQSLTNSNSGSDSRTSSSNNPSQQLPKYTINPAQPPPRRSQPLLSLTTDGPHRAKKSRSSATSQSTSQSLSLPSPVLPAYTDPRVALSPLISSHHDGSDHGFPSPGFGPRNKNRDLGAFLAQRGDV